MKISTEGRVLLGLSPHLLPASGTACVCLCSLSSTYHEIKHWTPFSSNSLTKLNSRLKYFCYTLNHKSFLHKEHLKVYLLIILIIKMKESSGMRWGSCSTHGRHKIYIYIYTYTTLFGNPEGKYVTHLDVDRRIILKFNLNRT
jgi:hypothetical protein